MNEEVKLKLNKELEREGKMMRGGMRKCIAIRIWPKSEYTKEQVEEEGCTILRETLEGYVVKLKNTAEYYFHGFYGGSATVEAENGEVYTFDLRFIKFIT